MRRRPGSRFTPARSGNDDHVRLRRPRGPRPRRAASPTDETLVKERPAAAPPGGPPPVVEETEYPPPPPPRGPLLWPWLLLLLLLVLGGLAAWFFISRDNDHAKNARARPAAPARIAVPNVVGLKQATALARIRAAGLTAELRTGRSKLPRGVVFAQQPTAGNQVPRRATVVVSVSNLGTVAVPNVTGLKSQPAVLRLRAAGLLAHLTTVRSPLPLGKVIRQKPVPGKSV